MRRRTSSSRSVNMAWRGASDGVELPHDQLGDVLGDIDAACPHLAHGIYQFLRRDVFGDITIGTRFECP